MRLKNSHCSYCGYPFTRNAPWPRKCVKCGNISYLNPAPVSVAIVPVVNGERQGIVVIRRGIEPGKGQLALPGGYITMGETWQTAGTREAQEETSVPLDAQHIKLFDVLSAPDGTVLIFGLYQHTFNAADLPPCEPVEELRHEILERTILYAPEELAFSLHTQVVQAYFQTHASA